MTQTLGKDSKYYEDDFKPVGKLKNVCTFVVQVKQVPRGEIVHNALKNLLYLGTFHKTLRTTKNFAITQGLINSPRPL